MQFLADESCDFAIVRALRASGHDVTTAADLVGGADDTVIAGLAVSEARMLLTEDKDFGQLAYATGHVQPGVILIRFSAGARRTVGAAGAQAVSRFGVRLVDSFVVVEPGRVRLGRTASRLTTRLQAGIAVWHCCGTGAEILFAHHPRRACTRRLRLLQQTQRALQARRRGT